MVQEIIYASKYLESFKYNFSESAKQNGELNSILTRASTEHCWNELAVLAAEMDAEIPPHPDEFMLNECKAF